MIDGGSCGILRAGDSRFDSGDSRLALDCGTGACVVFPADGIPRLDAISRANDGEESRCWVFTRAFLLLVVANVGFGVALPLLGGATSLDWLVATGSGATGFGSVEVES